MVFIEVLKLKGVLFSKVFESKAKVFEISLSIRKYFGWDTQGPEDKVLSWKTSQQLPGARVQIHEALKIKVLFVNNRLLLD